VALKSGVSELQLTDFRCFSTATLEPGPAVNLLIGDNASGKTSLLEALYLLGRGVSFRASRPDTAIRFGAGALSVFGRLDWSSPPHRLGLEVNRKSGLTVRVDGETAGRAELAHAFPVQILDPASHELIQGPPAERRRFLDWGVFHVEHGFLDAWQRYRRALQQRNAALRAGAAEAAWAWDATLADAGALMETLRRKALDRLEPLVTARAAALLDDPPELKYLPGWAEGPCLLEALRQARERDLAMGTTQVGPHRADLRIALRTRRARETVSRGQEKLLVAALMMAQVAMVSEALQGRAVLLVDEPGADLDRARLGRFQAVLWETPAQVFLTALDKHTFDPPPGSRLFHVEHGKAPILL
jgi:DNA replication and repair protein RecF